MSRLGRVSVAAAVVVLAAGCGASGDAETGTGTSSLVSASSGSVTTTDAAPTTAGSATTQLTSAPAESAPVVAVDPVTLSTAYYGYVWTSPTRRVSCRIADGEYTSGCMSGDAPVPDGADCVTPSFTIDQLSKGFYLEADTVIPTCFNQGIFGFESAPVLEYDRSVTIDGYTCTSRRTGMNCTTSSGHGFELSSEVARSY